MKNCSLGRSSHLPKFTQLSGKARIKNQVSAPLQSVLFPLNSAAFQGSRKDYALLNEELSADCSWMGKWFFPSRLLAFAAKLTDKNAQILDFYWTCYEKSHILFTSHSECALFFSHGGRKEGLGRGGWVEPVGGEVQLAQACWKACVPGKSNYLRILHSNKFTSTGGQFEIWLGHEWNEFGGLSIIPVGRWFTYTTAAQFRRCLHYCLLLLRRCSELN